MNAGDVDWLNQISFAIGSIGLGVILWGVVLSAVRFIRVEWSGLHGVAVSEEKEALRHHLGGYLLLGLEFLVAADIVHTVLTPSLHELGILGSIVAIRTVISVSINWELRQEMRREEKRSGKAGR